MANQTRVKVQGGHGKIRRGRGFSKRELEQAGVSLDALKQQGFLFDSRRRSCHDDNVEQLKAAFASE